MTKLKLAASEDAPEFARPEDTEQAAMFWDSLRDLLDESQLLPINQAVHRLASLLQEYRGAWPLIRSDAEVDPERGKALPGARVKRREYGYDVTLASGTLCPNCSRSLRATAVRHIDESGFDIICESCHADIIRAERR